MFAVLSIGFVLLELGISIATQQTYSLREYLSAGFAVVSGFVLLGLARGLAKQEKWAWYVTFIILVLPVISAIRELLSGTFSINLFFSWLILFLLFGLLMRSRKAFIKQPKEQFSSLLHKPLFIFIAGGLILLALIAMVTLAYGFL